MPFVPLSMKNPSPLNDLISNGVTVYDTEKSANVGYAQRMHLQPS